MIAYLLPQQLTALSRSAVIASDRIYFKDYYLTELRPKELPQRIYMLERDGNPRPSL